MHNYKELMVWKRSIELAELMYLKTNVFPDSEKFGLTSQMRRCAVSIASNIAEGAGRNGKGEFRQFLGYAYGSSCELETQSIISKNVGLIEVKDQNEINRLIQVIQKMIFNLKKTL
ncbi:MAG: four helix bundle protein [Reichenbachiella sp.]|uniref:four helix bundle protein n=1 Tax=Reichenbachiella sp. TaxID=2184521 RepID=UPI003264A6B4